MRPEPMGQPTRGMASRGMLTVASYVLWLVSAVLGLAGIFTIRRLAEVVLALALSGGGEGAGKWFGPALIVVTVVAGLALLVLLMVWEDRYRRASLDGFRSLLRRFGWVTALEAGVIGGSVLLTLLLLQLSL
jgi:hypothetical protein